jgi:hypothetical protein
MSNSYRTDPGMQLVTAYLPKQDADALVVIANDRGLSRAELLRRTTRDLIEQHEKRENQWTMD